jgi:hypothetical protein
VLALCVCPPSVSQCSPPFPPPLLGNPRLCGGVFPESTPASPPPPRPAPAPVRSCPPSFSFFPNRSSNCFSGFDDGPRGFYTVFRDLFAAVDSDEDKFGVFNLEKSRARAPTFGDSTWVPRCGLGEGLPGWVLGCVPGWLWGLVALRIHAVCCGAGLGVVLVSCGCGCGRAGHCSFSLPGVQQDNNVCLLLRRLQGGVCPAATHVSCCVVRRSPIGVVVAFYNYWEYFSSKMTFAWTDDYDPAEVRGRVRGFILLYFLFSVHPLSHRRWCTPGVPLPLLLRLTADLTVCARVEHPPPFQRHPQRPVRDTVAVALACTCCARGVVGVLLCRPPTATCAA